MEHNFKPGDVIFARRWRMGFVTYRHFGVYVGDDKVVNYQGDPEDETNPEKARIILSTLDQFANGDKVKADRVRKNPLPDEETVRRAMSFIGTGLGEYSLVFNNCEHFANFCKYGKKISRQVKKDVTIAGSVLAALAGLGIFLTILDGDERKA